MIRALTRTVAGLVTLPPALAHESVHAAASAPWADQLAIVIDAKGVDAAVGVDWSDETPPWYARVVAAYAPTVLGALAGIWGLFRLATGGMPREPTSMLVWGVVAIWWVIFTMPSGDDRAQAREHQQDATDSDQR